MYPKLEGRFLQVSGVSFAFDPAKPAGKRVDPKFVRIGDQYLEPESKYRLVTKAYLYAGKDGFDSLPRGKILVYTQHLPLTFFLSYSYKILLNKIDEEDSIALNCAVQNHFQAIQKMRGGKMSSRTSHHRQSLVTLSRRFVFVLASLFSLSCFSHLWLALTLFLFSHA